PELRRLCAPMAKLRSTAFAFFHDLRNLAFASSRGGAVFCRRRGHDGSDRLQRFAIHRTFSKNFGPTRKKEAATTPPLTSSRNMAVTRHLMRFRSFSRRKTRLDQQVELPRVVMHSRCEAIGLGPIFGAAQYVWKSLDQTSSTREGFRV